MKFEMSSFIKNTILTAYFCIISGVTSSAADDSVLVENAQALLTHADACYWFALNEHGDLGIFTEGLEFIDEAEGIVRGVSNEAVQNELMRNVVSLRDDILEQYNMAHDTLYGAFPLFRFYTNDDETFELIDEPFRTAPIRAAEGLIDTIVEQWYRMPQVDIVFNSVVRHDGDGNSLSDSTLSSIPLQNEMSYIFNQNSKFFVHTDRELVSALDEQELKKFYADEVDLNISNKICDQFSIERFLKVTAVELDVFEEYWFYIVRAQLYENEEGIREDRMFVYGFGVDSRDKLPFIIVACIVLLLLPVFYSYFCYQKRVAVLLVLISVSVVSLLVSLGAGAGLATLEYSPEDLVKQILWIVVSASSIIFVVPFLAMLGVHVKIIKPLFGHDFLADPKGTFTYCFAVFCGALIAFEYAILTYSDVAVGVGILALVFFAGTAVIWGSVCIIANVEDNSTKIKFHGIGLALSSVFCVLFALNMMPSGTSDPFTLIVLLGYMLIMAIFGCLIVLNANKKGLQQVSRMKYITIFSTLLVFFSLGLVSMTANLQLLLAATCPLVFLWGIWGKSILSLSAETSSKQIERLAAFDSESTEYSLDDILADPVGKLNYQHPLVADIIARMSDLSDSSPHPIAIIGEAGSGKTTLLKQVFSDVSLGHINLFRIGVQKTDVPYQMVEQLGEKLGSMIQKQDRFNEMCNRLASLVPLPGIATMLIDGLGGDEEVVVVSNAEIAHRLYEVLCDNAPLCVWVDDGENMDSQSAEVLSMISSYIKEEDRIALVTCFACDFNSNKDWENWIAGSAFESLALQFSRHELGVFFGKMSLEKESTAILLEYVGHFSLSASKAVEWLRLLQMKEWIGGEVAPYKLLKDINSGMPKPSHFYEFIANKLSQLSIRLVSFLECAACVGKQFDATLVAEALNESLPALLLELEEIERIHMIRDHEDVHNDYSFTSSIYVEIILDRLNNRDHPGQMRLLAFEYHARLTKVLIQRYQAYHNKKLLFLIASHALHRSDDFIEDSVSWNLLAIDEYIHRHLAKEAILLCEKIGPHLRVLHTRHLQLQYYALKLEAFNDARLAEHQMSEIRSETKFLKVSIFKWLKDNVLNESERVYGLRLLVNYALNCRLAGLSDSSYTLECFECCSVVINEAKEDREQLWKVQALHYLGLAHQQNGDLKSCQDDLNAAILLAENSKTSKSVRSQLYNSRAQYAYDRSVWNLNIIVDYNQSLDLKKSTGDLLGQAMTLGGLTGYYMGLGEAHVQDNLTQLWDWTTESFSINTTLCSAFGQMLAIQQAFSLLNLVSDLLLAEQWKKQLAACLLEWHQNLIDGSGVPRSECSPFLKDCQTYEQLLQGDSALGHNEDCIYVLDEITLHDHILKNHYYGKTPGSRFWPNASGEPVADRLKLLLKKVVNDPSRIEEGSIYKFLATDTGEIVGVDNLIQLTDFPASKIIKYTDDSGYRYNVVQTKGVETSKVTLVCVKLNISFEGRTVCRVASMYPSDTPLDIKSRDDINELGLGFAVE